MANARNKKRGNPGVGLRNGLSVKWLRTSKRKQPDMVIKEEIQKHEKESPLQKDAWVISIDKNIEAAKKDNTDRSWEKISIYRVPRLLRDPSDHKAYTPQVVSLGPYHYRSEGLKQMERHKWRALQRVLDRNSQNKEHYLDKMKERVNDGRACYEGMLDDDRLNNNQFAEMMLLDGCFILEILRGATESKGFEALGYSSNDPIFCTQGITHLAIQRDMIMLENQVPLFVLDVLLKLQVEPSAQQLDVDKLAIAFFKQLMPEDKTKQKDVRNKVSNAPSINESQSIITPPTEGSLHFLDVIRNRRFNKGGGKAPNDDPAASEREGRQKVIQCVTQLKDDGIKIKKRMTDGHWTTKFITKFTAWVRKNFSRNSAADERCQEPIRCVTELKDANIKIKKRKTGSLWDIKFENGILHIPPIVIDDGTKSLLFNLIAFEQCHPPHKQDVTSYIIFLDHLINSAEDVKYLHKHGIIEHWLGSDTEVAYLINGLGKEVVIDMNDNPNSSIYKDINEYYRRPWNAWRATLKSRYFNNPWSIISFVAAVFLLIMTAAQAYFAFCSYYWPAK